MSFEVKYNKDLGIVEARVWDIYNAKLLGHMVPEISSLLIQNDCSLLFMDLIYVIFELTPDQIVAAPEKLAGIFLQYNIDLRKIRRALLISRDEEKFQLFKDKSIQLDQPISIFFSEEESLHWLKK